METHQFRGPRSAESRAGGGPVARGLRLSRISSATSLSSHFAGRLDLLWIRTRISATIRAMLPEQAKTLGGLE